MQKIRMHCHGKTVTRQVHHAKTTNRDYVMERKPGGGVKRKYL